MRSKAATLVLAPAFAVTAISCDDSRRLALTAEVGHRFARRCRHRLICIGGLWQPNVGGRLQLLSTISDGGVRCVEEKFLHGTALCGCQQNREGNKP